jgi:hypothetical protein
LEVSEEWSVTDHPECLTLEISDQGALQASSSHKHKGLVTEEDLFFSAEQRKAWGSWQPACCGEFEGIAYEYTEGEIIWRRGFLRRGQTLLFVTYNGSSVATEQERFAVDQVLSTVLSETSGEA